MSALGLATLGVQCNNKSLGMASLGVFCGLVAGWREFKKLQVVINRILTFKVVIS